MVQSPIKNSKLILSEIEKYNKKKDEIRTKTQKDFDAVILDEKTKTASFSVVKTKQNKFYKKS